MARRDAGELVQQSKDRLLDSLKTHASRLYDAVKVAAGQEADNVIAPNFKAAAEEIVKKETALTGVQAKSASVARGAAAQFTPPDPASLPAQLANQWGLNQDKVWTLDALREWQSRLGALVANTENRVARRDLTRMFAAVGKDIEQWGNNLAPQAKALLDQANTFYKTQIAEVYFNRLSSGIDKAEPDLVAALFLGPNKSAVAMDRVKKAIGQAAWDKAAGSYLDEVMSGAKTADGRFSPTAAIQALDNHAPDVLEKLFGRQLTAEKAVVKMLQRNPTEMIKGIVGQDGDKIVDMLLPKQGSIQPIREMRQVLSKDTFDRTAGALTKKIVERSLDNTGEFSFDRFLTQVNSRTGYTQEQLRGLYGQHYGEFREVVDLLARINSNLKFAGNPSGTGQSMISQFQLGGAILLGTDIAAKTWQGREDIPQLLQHVGTGVALLSPAAIGRLIYSKGGLQWLTEGMKLKPGTDAAAKAIMTAKGILINGALGIAPERGRNDEAQTVGDQVKAALRDKNLSIDQKIQAALAGSQMGGVGSMQNYSR